MRGSCDALGRPDVDQCVLVAARLVVILAEGIACKEQHQARIFEQVRFLRRAAIGRGDVVAGGLEQTGVLVGIV